MNVIAKCTVCGADAPKTEGGPPVCAACVAGQTAKPPEVSPDAARLDETPQDDGLRVTLQEALFGPAAGESPIGYMCQGCGSAIRGVNVGKDAYMASADLSQFPVSGYQCAACAAYFCASCKMGVLQWSSFGGFDRSKCPHCQEAFRPAAVVLDGEPRAVGALLGGGVEEAADTAHPGSKGLSMKLGLVAGLASVALLLAAGFGSAPTTVAVGLAVAGLVAGVAGLSLCSSARVAARAARHAVMVGAEAASPPPEAVEPGAAGPGTA